MKIILLLTLFFCIWNKFESLQDGIFFLVHIFARDILVEKKLEFQKTKPTFIISVEYFFDFHLANKCMSFSSSKSTLEGLYKIIFDAFLHYYLFISSPFQEMLTQKSKLSLILFWLTFSQHESLSCFVSKNRPKILITYL